MNKGKKSIENSSQLYRIHTTFVIKKINLKVYHHTGGKWFIQTSQGEPVAKSDRRLLIILSLVCKSGIKVAHFILSNPLFKKNIRGQKHPREVAKCGNGSPNISHVRYNNKYKHSVHNNHVVSGNGRPL